MSTTQKQRESVIVSAVPEIAVPTAERAIMLANRWLQKETAMLIHVTQATFNPVTFFWHLPVRLSYPDRGTIGMIGDIFLHAGSGEFVGLPDPHDLLQRAESLAEAHGLVEEEGDEEE